MKSSPFQSGRDAARRGFGLVEVTLSLGILSLGLLTLAPLMALGLKTARQARGDRESGQIARTLAEEARQGTLQAGTSSLDLEGQTCDATVATYTAQSTFSPLNGNACLTNVSIKVTPVGAPDRAWTYQVIVAPAP